MTCYNFRVVLVITLTVGFVFPRNLVIAAGVGEPPTIRDVALHQDGLLLGQVLSKDGTPVAGVPVTISRENRVLGTATTNEKGIFAFRGLKGGVYQLTSANGVVAYRVWQSQTAPPGASPAAIVVAGEDAVRGQLGCGYLGMFLSRPLVIAGVIGAAIAVPLAIALSEDEEEAPATP
jgi:hypothetical protein